jgi:peptidoglycan/xylan/chitin deacetylase (PgdA/CDA1 family)
MTMQGTYWPNGNRIAVVVGVLFEAWAEGKAPSYFPRTTTLKPGAVDHGGIRWAEYAGNEGVWRIIRILDLCKTPATFFCSARSAELYPEAIHRIVASGHHIAAHGYTQDEVLSAMTAEQQQATIRTSLDILEKAAGKRPVGWVSAAYGWNDETVALLVKEGVQWHADALDSSLPRRQVTPSGSIMAFPWSDFVDNRVLRSSPRDYYDAYKETFDYLYAHEPMGLIHIGFHSHFGGRPLMSAMLLKVLEYLHGFRDVWFVRHDDLVRWMVQRKIDELPYRSRFFASPET